MPNYTDNLRLFTFLENEPVDFEQINENFEKIDKLPLTFEAGEKTAGYTGGGSESTATWHYKKYNGVSNNVDAKIVEMSTVIELTSVKSDGGTKAPYYSGDVVVNLPFTFDNIFGLQMQMASESYGWVVDLTPKTSIDELKFKILSIDKEETLVNKRVFIDVKGVLTNG